VISSCRFLRPMNGCQLSQTKHFKLSACRAVVGESTTTTQDQSCNLTTETNRPVRVGKDGIKGPWIPSDNTAAARAIRMMQTCNAGFFGTPPQRRFERAFTVRFAEIQPHARSSVWPLTRFSGLNRSLGRQQNTHPPVHSDPPALPFRFRRPSCD